MSICLVALTVMPDLFSLLLFVVVATITPGGATTLATTSGVHFGLLRSMPLIVGIAFGLAVLAAMASLGLGGVLLAMPRLQIAVKVVGSVYLLWLGWRIARSAPQRGAGTVQTQPIGLAKGFLLLWLNPKSWAMTVGAAASFTSIASSPVAVACLLAASFGVAAFASLSLWCGLGMLLARLLSSDRRWRTLNICMGALLAASVIATWS